MNTKPDVPAPTTPTRSTWLGAIVGALVGGLGAMLIVRSLGGLVDNAVFGAMQGLTPGLVYLTNAQFQSERAAQPLRYVRLTLGFILGFYLIMLLILWWLNLRSEQAGLGRLLSSWIGWMGSSLGGLLVPMYDLWRRQRA